MALETLKDVKEIGGFEVGFPSLENSPSEQAEALHKHIMLNLGANCIAFRIQNGPIKEVGVNGCQVDTLIEAAKLIIEKLNKDYPCRENALVITKLDEALLWLLKRKLDRTNRGVEGHNKL